MTPVPLAPDQTAGASRVSTPTARPPAAVIVLAAGEGTRMKSATPKVLHRIGGRTLVGHAIAAARAVGPRAPRRRRAPRARPRRRARRRGRPRGASSPTRTRSRAPAAPTSAPSTRLPPDLAGTVLVTYGDVPLLAGDTLRRLLAAHDAAAAARSPSITAHLDDPTGYGRILRGADGGVDGIVEQKDATDEQRAITEINSGIYAFDAPCCATPSRRSAPTTPRARSTSPTSLAIARDGRRPRQRPPRRRPLADRGRQRPGPARAARRGAQPPHHRAADARRA